MKGEILALGLALIIVSCSDSGTAPASRDFNLKFSYGIDSKNVLNTYQNTYTKDLILDGTITVPFTLSESDLERISAMMLEINFYGYPDTFHVSMGDTVATITPHATYNFEVAYKSSIKRLHWVDSIMSEDLAAVKLRVLIKMVQNIIESNPR